MNDLLSNPIFWIIVGASSEIIAFTPLKENSIIQLLFNALRSLKGQSVKKP